MRPLIPTNLALLGAVAVHGYDHIRQERGLDALTTEVRVGGALIALLAAGSLVLAVRDHPRAHVICGAIGAYVAIGVTLSHFAPAWSAFSDPYAGLGLDWFSWFAAGLEVAAAAALAVVGLGGLGRRRAAAA